MTVCNAGWQIIGKEYTNRPDDKIRNQMDMDRVDQGPIMKRVKSNADKCKVFCLGLFAI